LSGIRVLDLAETRGLFAGKFLADLGADVLKIENPAGSQARSVPPFRGDKPGLENSLYFINFNTNKRGITLDIEKPGSQDIFKKLAAKADIVIEDLKVGTMRSLGLDYPALKDINPRLIMASVSAFGQSGPYSQYRATDIVSFAMGGLMNRSGAPDEAPVVAPCEQAYHASSLLTAFGILTALFLRLKTGVGQYLDMSSHEVMSSFSEGFMLYSVISDIGGRSGSQFGAGPGRIYPCKDGYVHYLVLYPNHWQSFLELIGNPELLSDKAWYDASFRAHNIDVIDTVVNDFSLNHTRDEIVSACQSRGIPCTPVNNPSDVSRDPHMLARGFSTEVDHSVIGKHKYLAPPYLLSKTPATVRRPAPLLGQHNTEVYQDELGLSLQEIQNLKKDNII
jgi:crotonobetainyl-CoA:carnitine CoA-transferase CaiB-like acyl-CoA transferase